MITLDQAITSATEALGTLPGVRSCEPFGGRFDLDDLQRFGTKAPSIRVAVLRIVSTSWVDTGEFDALVEIGAFIVTRDEPGKPRDRAALELMQRVMAMAHAAQWGLSKTQPGRGVRAENLFSATVQKTGVALWGVSWTAKVRMGTDAYAPVEDAITEIWARDAAADGELEFIAGTGEQP